MHSKVAAFTDIGVVGWQQAVYLSTQIMPNSVRFSM